MKILYNHKIYEISRWIIVFILQKEDESYTKPKIVKFYASHGIKIKPELVSMLRCVEGFFFLPKIWKSLSFFCVIIFTIFIPLQLMLLWGFELIIFRLRLRLIIYLLRAHKKKNFLDIGNTNWIMPSNEYGKKFMYIIIIYIQHTPYGVVYQFRNCHKMIFWSVCINPFRLEELVTHKVWPVYYGLSYTRVGCKGAILVADE